MKPIRIEKENAAAIEAALHAVNGTARQHAYSEFSEISAIAECAESQVNSLVGGKIHAKGAVWMETSGAKVCTSYARKGFRRAATAVRLERRATGWFLADAKKVEVWQQGGGCGRLTLTAEQAEIAVKKFRAQFAVAE